MKVVKMLAAVMAAGVMMAGCAVSAPGYEAGAETAVTEPVEGYAFGDIVWALERWPDGRIVTCRYAVVSCEGDMVIVTHAVSDSPEALRECLHAYIEDGAEVWRLDAEECYATEDAAQAAADEMNGVAGCE